MRLEVDFDDLFSIAESGGNSIVLIWTIDGMETAVGGPTTRGGALDRVENLKRALRTWEVPA